MVDKLFVATKGFISHKGKILMVRESSKYKDGANAGKFDLVGGRVEPGQRFDESLKREIKEETGLDVEIGDPFHVGEWRPKVKDQQWQIVGIFFECKANSDSVQLSEDHDEFIWIDPHEYEQHPIIESNRVTFQKYLQRKK